MGNSQYIERRSGHDRRGHAERWQGPDRRSGVDRRSAALLEALSFGGPVRSDRRADAAGNFGKQEGAAVRQFCVPSTRDVLDNVGGMLADLISGFYDANMDARPWPEILSKLRAAIHADVCFVTQHDFNRQSGRFEHWADIDTLYVSAYADLYAAENPWVRDPDRFSKPGVVWTSQDLLPDAQLVDSDFYRYWLRPQELFHHLFGVIDADQGRSQLVVFGRSYNKGAFWQDDAAMLRRLLPAMRLGLRAGQRFQRECAVQKIALGTLDAMPIGVVLLNREGGIAAANRTAREIIDSDDGLFIGSGGLGLKLAGGRVRFRDYIAGGPGRAADQVSELIAIPVPRPSGRRPLTVIAVPVRHVPEGIGDALAAVVFVGDPERPVDIDPRMLTRLYGLSRAEARVAAILATGKRLEQVAESLGLTYETVRKHLKQIFAKSGTERQAELIRTVTSGPAGLRF
jgi:DNA-binding CsgD family transcriptional regulator/PAS domain-containing protein